MKSIRSHLHFLSPYFTVPFLHQETWGMEKLTLFEATLGFRLPRILKQENQSNKPEVLLFTSKSSGSCILYKSITPIPFVTLSSLAFYVLPPIFVWPHPSLLNKGGRLSGLHSDEWGRGRAGSRR